LHVEHYVRSAQIAERGKIDMVFFADGAGVRQADEPRGSLCRTGRDIVELEPMTLLPALARELGEYVAITTNGLDCLAALYVSGVNRPFLVLPPSVQRQNGGGWPAVLARARDRAGGGPAV
jgi:hypothetical protein